MGSSPVSAAEVFVGPEEAARLLRDDGARVLDARGDRATAPYLPGAVVTSWMDVRAGVLREGRLASSAKARAHYAAKGVRLDRPVLVYGAGGAAWGEEGRIWWDLRYLGHPRVFILDGGVAAWTAAEQRTAAVPSGPLPGAFGEVPEVSRLRADHREVGRLAAGSGVVLDVRTEAEYGGARHYFEARGGHVPGARHLHWKELLGPSGRLRPAPELRALLHAHGVSVDRPVAAYCTGGVRSGFVVAVLEHLGVDASNYDGSWWDWSAREELPVEGP